MYHKPFSFFIFISCISILLCACSNKNKVVSTTPDFSFDSVTVSVNDLPDSYALGIIMNTPDRQQIVYSDNAEHRIVIEIMLENNDKIDLTKEELLLKDFKGYSYTYHGELIEYPHLNDSIVANMYQIQEGNCVVEWNQSNFFCRIFGNLTQEDLLNIAESVVIFSNE